MTEPILQLGLLAQDDAGKWMEILFIVVVAVFWAIGGLVKAARSSRIPHTDLKSILAKPAARQRGTSPLAPIKAVDPL